MRIAPLPENEKERLRTLRSYAILDTLPEAGFDDLTRLASEICAAPVALVSLLDEHRQWFKSAVGLEGMGMRETPRSVSFCAHAILQDDVFSVQDATQDDRFADNPFVAGDPLIRFYAGAPLRTTEGLNLGTLCVLDTVPRVLDAFQQRALRTLSAQVVAQLELRHGMVELAHREAEIRDQHQALGRLQRQKDQLASMVVHDLKNPIAAILPNVRFVLAHARLSSDERDAVRDIESSAEAMHGMLMDLLDISRSADGKLTPKWANLSLTALIEDVRQTAARRAREQGHKLTVSVALANDTLRGDPALLRRVLENLIDNSFKYAGAAEGAITLEAKSAADGFVHLSVCDEGPGVPAPYREKIFEPYAQLDRDANAHARSSRGLGLSFCRLAIEAHGGTIWVEDNVPEGSAFRMRLPAG
jgi:signal transduction histidine kinase